MKKYRIEKSERVDSNRSYLVWLLVESETSDKDEFYQREKVIADFGNTKREENYQNAKMVKQFFENRAFWE